MFPREQPPTALRCVSHSAPSSRAEYVVSVCYKSLTERQKVSSFADFLCVFPLLPKSAKGHTISAGFKVYANADRLCGCHYCRKGQRVTPFPQGFKVYANTDRLFCGTIARKVQRVTPNYKGLGSRLYCFGFPMMPPPPKGQRVTALCAYPLP